jgi:Xaa-Pro aminopeptidase
MGAIMIVAAMGFSTEERDRRWERARQLMAEQGWAALLVSGEDGLCGGNFRYLADFRPVKGHTLLLLPLEGEPVLWVEHRVHEQAAKKLSFVPDSRYTLDCGEAAAEELAGRGLSSGVVGSEELALLPASWYITWSERLPGLRLVDASPELAQLRRVKSAEEIELCRRSCEIADGSYEHLLPKLREGMTEFEIDAELEYYCRRNGADRLFNVYATSSLAELPWSASARPLERGRAALLEISPQVEGYWTQLVRVVSIGEPSPILAEMHRVTMAAMDDALDDLGPGVPIGGPLGRMERIIEDAGFEVMATDTGHDLGCTLGEHATWLTRETAFEAEPGQVFEIHPVVMHPDGGCLLIGDTYLITQSGVERMNRSPRELAVV